MIDKGYLNDTMVQKKINFGIETSKLIDIKKAAIIDNRSLANFISHAAYEYANKILSEKENNDERDI